MKKLFPVLAMSMAIVSCHKKNDDVAPALTLNQTTISFAPVSGASADVIVESNTDWQASFNSGIDWLQLSKTSGHGNDTIHVSVVRDDTARVQRTAVLTVAAVNASGLQAQVTISQKPYNVQLISQKLLGGTSYEYIDGMAPASDGGCLLVGYTASDNTGEVRASHGNTDVWIVRLNSNGDTLWTRTMGGTGYEEARGTVATSDGGFVVVAHTNSNNTGDVGTLTGNYDLWIIKLKSNGDTAWTKMIGSTDLYNYSDCIAATADGGFVIGGEVSAKYGNADVKLVKLNSNGNIVWQKNFGGTGIDYISSISVAADGSLWASVTTNSSSTGDVGTNHGEYDWWIMKLSASGDIQWSKLFGGTASDYVGDIKSTPDGGCIVAGTTASSETGDVGKIHGAKDMWVVKLNSSGNISWNTLLGGSGYDGDGGTRCIAIAADGGYLITGSTNSSDGDLTANQGSYDAWILKLNSSGTKLWSKTFGGLGEEGFGALSVTADGTIRVSGGTESNNSGDIGASHGSNDGWFIKMKDY